MILRVQVEEVKEIQVDLSAMVCLVRFRAKFYITLFVSIEDVRSRTESRENLAEFVVLVRFVEASGDLVHTRHRASWGHVDPKGGKEAKDATFKIFRVLHDILLVTRISWVNSISKSPIIVVPLHHEWSSWVVLGMLLWWPHFTRPAS